MKLTVKQLRTLINEESKFSSNHDRMKYLHDLFLSDGFDKFQKQSWEWVKTGVFTKQEYVEMLKMLWTRESPRS